MRRRQFITLLGGAVTCPLAARAQQPGRVRRVGVLMTFAADDPDGQADFAVLAQGLQEFGWTVGRNLRLDYRWVRTNSIAFAHTRQNSSRFRRTWSLLPQARS